MTTCWSMFICLFPLLNGSGVFRELVLNDSDEWHSDSEQFAVIHPESSKRSTSGSRGAERGGEACCWGIPLEAITSRDLPP